MERERVIDAAVNWWADKVSRRYHHDNGATDSANKMGMFMADMLFKPVTDEQLDVFKRELRKRIEAESEKDIRQIWLCTDYAPCYMLSESANIAGINELNFPFKTNMVIEKDKVMVSDGYCQPYVEITVETP